MSRFRRAVTWRQATGLTPKHVGHMTMYVGAWLPMGGMVKSPLARLANLLRRDLGDWGHEWVVRSYATRPSWQKFHAGLGCYNAGWDARRVKRSR